MVLRMRRLRRPSAVAFSGSLLCLRQFGGFAFQDAAHAMLGEVNLGGVYAQFLLHAFGAPALDYVAGKNLELTRRHQRPHPAGWSRSLREERRYWPMPPGDTPDDWELVGPEPYQYFHRKHRRPPTQLIEEAPGIVP